MDYYINLINNTIDYIEENAHKKLTSRNISKEFCISEFHFNRIFKAVVGTTLKQYILGRKLTLAHGVLSRGNRSIIDTAYDFSFEYPEVFSRAFKRQFGVAPSNHNIIDTNKMVKRAIVVKKDITNYKGALTLKGSYEYLCNIYLEGMAVEVNENSENFKSTLQSTWENFNLKTENLQTLRNNKFYTVVNCHGKNDGRYRVFYGKEKCDINQESVLESRIIPEGWYINFSYSGDMFNIRESFTDDLYRWLALKGIELRDNGIGMLNIYDIDYCSSGNVSILIPIRK